MKRFQCAALLVASLVVVQAHDTPSGSVPRPVSEAKELGEMVLANKDKVLASLEYWGTSSFEWETGWKALSTAGKTAPENVKLFGLPCRRELGYEAPSKELNRVRYLFGDGITNRVERAKQYRQLKTELVNAYNSATHKIKDDEVFRGRDAYEQGLDKEYHLEWHGPETIADLYLSDGDLYLEFRKSPLSRAGEKKELIRRTKLIEQEKTNGGQNPGSKSK